MAVGLLSGPLPTIPLLLPNPYVPAPIWLIHLVETSTCTFLYGCLVGCLFTRGIPAPAATPIHLTHRNAGQKPSVPAAPRLRSETPRLRGKPT